MKTFKVEIKLGNDTMQEPFEVAGALDKISETLRALGCDWPNEIVKGDIAPVRDMCGNTVGWWEITR